MKNQRSLISLAAFLALMSTSRLVWAETVTTTETTTTVTTWDTTAIDREANTPAGERTVINRLMQEFGIDEARIRSLHAQHLGYGEIRNIFKIASQMPEGLTDKNINEVVSLRRERGMEWNQVARHALTNPTPSIVPSTSNTDSLPSSPPTQGRRALQPQPR